MDLIIYHNNCPDGFCAAIIARKRYPEAAILGLNHGTPGVLETLLPMVAGKDVLMVDFSLRTRAENIKLHEVAKSFRIYDHHKSARAELENLDFAVFDMNRSGAGLTWDELFGVYNLDFYNTGHEIRIGPGRAYIGMPEIQRPWYVDYVQDRDLWKHSLPQTREVNAFIMTLPFTEQAWRVLDLMTPAGASALGAGAVAHVNHYVREIVEHRQMGNLDGFSHQNYTVAVVNAPYLNISEVGNVLATDHADIGMGWFERGDGVLQFSLRSNGDIDVSEIAKLYGGGGHRNASGFQMSISDGRKFIDSVLGRK